MLKDKAPMISLSHASKSFNRRVEAGTRVGRGETRSVLKDVSLEADEGEIVAIMGKNGSGKTTLSRVLATLIELDGGTAKVCGYDTRKDSREVRRRIGVMLNAGDGGFQPRLSGMRNLRYYASLYDIPGNQAISRIKFLLNELGLADRGSDQYQMYSSGMRRRLAFARSLLPDSPVLLLDEPTLGIDPWSTREIHQKLKELAGSGKTIFCTTNSPVEADAVGDRIGLLDNGVLTVSTKAELQLA